MKRGSDNPWLHRFAVLTALSTLALICMGGLVTSHGAGLAVPDWPTTYGYNMFFFPISQWVGGIFYEHTHRLMGAWVGFLTIGLALWLWLCEERAWLRRLGVIALVGVVLQGVLGGLRVTQLKDELGIVHATLAQLFFVLISAIALFTSQRWQRLNSIAVEQRQLWLRCYTALSLVILFQLILAATMRHQHAGLAVPDFPLAYGKIWPDLDPAAIERYNQMRMETRGYKDITAFHVVAHLAHRFTALVILAGVGAAWWLTRRRLGTQRTLTKLCRVWLGLVLAQVGLGAATVWSDKSADIATAHVAVGALSLVTGVLLCLIANKSLSNESPPVFCGTETSGHSGDGRSSVLLTEESTRWRET